MTFILIILVSNCVFFLAVKMATEVLQVETPSLNITTLSEFDIKENFPPNFIQGLSSSGKTSRITKKIIWTKMIELFKVYRVQCTCSCPRHLPRCLQLLLKLLLSFSGEEKQMKSYTWCPKKSDCGILTLPPKTTLNCNPKRDYFSGCRGHRKDPKKISKSS